MALFERATLAQLLKNGLQGLQLDLSQAQQDQLLDYLALLHKWNHVYNLTSVRDPVQMMTLHLLDSLAAVPAFVGATNVLDVGAGGGLPGIVLAIARPDMNVSMIDTVHKKTAFLTQVKVELGLANVTVYTKKVQDLHVKQPFDVITSRAFADLSDFIEWSRHLLAEDGRFIALKGTAPEDERARLQERLQGDWKVQDLQALRVPGLDAERHLVFVQRAETV
ncbi:16S rRNA (guanine(527)-N(7))-methyltransferase RsmG [Massilia sp. YMA4]|uniref:16S rRNA (guanine(527)-N(7))-methyltransferase RsmG n=1 Tax=Massilia sp. YMA4 TaxID=1593482 RepID=UPI000DD14D01|nr:16S rRNA (guanine(527)-N(7))-methyltransferase RsmG [Massilia sp. YMA4]AXA93227.1 16S rRNA (guanine(527)-N(7))-methyltransferase RsmG [Massilia sp. YMA4]